MSHGSPTENASSGRDALERYGRFPFEHAWFVHGDAVIDPTLLDPHGYFLRVAFGTPFAMEVLRRTGRYEGILTEGVSMHRYHGTPKFLERGLQGMRDVMPVHLGAWRQR